MRLVPRDGEACSVCGTGCRGRTWAPRPTLGSPRPPAPVRPSSELELRTGSSGGQIGQEGLWSGEPFRLWSPLPRGRQNPRPVVGPGVKQRHDARSGAGGQVSLPFRGLAWGHCGLSAGPSGGAGSRDPNPEEQWLRTRGACAGLPGQRREPTGLQASRPGAPSPAQPPEGPRHGLCLRDSGLRQRGLCSLETCPEGPAIPTSSPAF